MKPQKKPAPDRERAELEQQVESLRPDIRRLELERDILKKANELVKKGMGIDPQLVVSSSRLMTHSSPSLATIATILPPAEWRDDIDSLLAEVSDTGNVQPLERQFV